MSKKLYSTAKWKKHLRRRQLSQLKALQRRRRHPRVSRRLLLHQKRQTEIVKVPHNFSLVSNPVEVISFFNRLHLLAARNHLTLDMSGTSVITTEAVTALIASISSVESDTYIRGNQPNNEAAKHILAESGFFQHVKVRGGAPASKLGLILRTESTTVEPKLARDLIHFGTKAIYGESRRCPAAYRVLIESMNNTRNHASKEEASRKTWWCTAFADSNSGRVCYTFLDTGVGIFRSVRLSIFRRAYRAAGLTRNSDILHDILEGKVESSTGIPYRGKGLPAIYSLARAKKIKSLIIITNDVYANVSQGDYQNLDLPFHGTLLYWETE